MTSMKIVKFSRPPTPLVQNSSTPLNVQFQTNTPPPLQIIPNQIKGNMILGWRYVIRSFLQVGFLFQYLLSNLVWLFTDFFSFSWSESRPQSNFYGIKISSRLPFIVKRRAGVKLELKPIYFFVALHPCVRSCPKISRNAFLKKVF